MATRIVLIAGAGATLADCMRLPERKRPPLDQGFFNAEVRRDADLAAIASYMKKHYRTDISKGDANSLERVMAVLFTDIFGGGATDEAFVAFRQLLRVFLKRLANTTNDLPTTSQGRLYRMIAKFIDSETALNDFTIITFNQDLQIEKVLSSVAGTTSRAHLPLFRFPNCYRIPFDQVTAPSANPNTVFPADGGAEQGIAVLKLHGSMNWYSLHNSPNPSRRSLLDQNRSIRLTRRRNIDNSMTLSRTAAKGGNRFTFPVVVPPVIHKAQVIPSKLKPIWDLAEERLRQAERVIIFGYSCPPTDWESANMISRALNENPGRAEVSIVNPDPRVVLRFQALGSLRKLNYYRTADDYLSSG